MSYIQNVNSFLIHNVLTTPTYIFLPIVAILYRLFYVCMDTLLYNSPKYILLNRDRQYYIMFNMSKSIVLMLLSYLICIGYTHNIISMQYIDWSQQTILKNITGLYGITDIMPLFVNRKKMMTSTIIHHVCVMFAMCGIIISNLEIIGLSNAIILYGLFSSLAFIVNGYLGLRFIIHDSNILYYFKKATFINYILSCSVNWAIQSGYLIVYMWNSIYAPFNMFSLLYLLAYISFLYFWISDDIILMRFLLK